MSLKRAQQRSLSACPRRFFLHDAVEMHKVPNCRHVSRAVVLELPTVKPPVVVPTNLSPPEQPPMS